VSAPGRLRRNLIANLAGNAWQSLMGIIFIPAYIHFLGIECFGVIGLFASVLAIVALLDLGLSSTMTREVARLSAGPTDAGELRCLTYTLERIYWAAGLLITIAAICLASPATSHWLRPIALPHGQLTTSLMLAGTALALQWPASIYSGGLTGLDRQVALNTTTAISATLRGAGAVVVLWLYPSLTAFFAWQALVSFATSLTLRWQLWAALPQHDDHPRFQLALLARAWRFAAGMTGIAVLGTLFTQLDKLILSRLVSLEQLGYYALAGVIATALMRIAVPIFSSVYPRLVQLATADDRPSLSETYHRGSQIMATLLIPMSLVIALFAWDIIRIWTRQTATADAVAPLASVLIIGTAITGVLHLPYALQLAHGWVSLPLITNLIATVIYIPLLIMSVTFMGPAGAAWTWVALNAVELIIPVVIMHRRHLRGEALTWYVQDTLMPLLACMAVVLLARWMMPRTTSSSILLPGLALTLVLATLAAGLASNRLRSSILERFGRAC
jgi:O-antigen/teichoic acid export membrane protein